MGCNASQELRPKKEVPQKATIKIPFLGKSGVGKSSIALRYCHNYFSDQMEVTIGASFLTKNFASENLRSPVKIELWDTAGQERYRALVPMYYRNADIVVLVYDITVEQTFKALEDWISEIKRNLPGIPIIICGNKSDLYEYREVSSETGERYAENNGCLYIETSSKTPDNIDKLFELAVEHVVGKTS